MPIAEERLSLRANKAPFNSTPWPQYPAEVGALEVNRFPGGVGGIAHGWQTLRPDRHLQQPQQEGQGPYQAEADGEIGEHQGPVVLDDLA